MPFEPTSTISEIILGPPPSITEGQFRWVHDQMKIMVRQSNAQSRAIRELQEWAKAQP